MWDLSSAGLRLSMRFYLRSSARFLISVDLRLGFEKRLDTLLELFGFEYAEYASANLSISINNESHRQHIIHAIPSGNPRRAKQDWVIDL